MYFERDIDAALNVWKNAPVRKPLLLRGVRQCGKTSSVRHLGSSFESYIEINLERQKSLHHIFEGDLDIRRIISLIEIEVKRPIVPGKTLLFIDEIQECPSAITSLRYFYEDAPELHVIAAGSLLEFVLRGKQGDEEFDFPVGRVRSLYMYPFSFREFLTGAGEQLLRAYLDEAVSGKHPNEMHDKLLDLYKTFLLVGGMPEAVATYLNTGSLLETQVIHRDIALNFRDDFEKYSRNIPAEMIRKTYDYALRHVCSQTKSASAIPGMSAYYFDECIRLLQRAGIIYQVKATSCDTLPLGSGEKATNTKLVFFDTGIYLTENALDAGSILAAREFDELNKGEVVEMQTGLEMLKSVNPAVEPSLYYWYRSGANAEVDYVVQKGDRIVPVEVKASGKGSMQSLYAFLERSSNVSYGIRVSMENFNEYDRIHVCPVYAAGYIAQDCEV